jgi:hypothetical protein|tara:strand:+ start:111 stop:323 length:213 start_codon:yes stop_codon:yes gene_type:complete
MEKKIEDLSKATVKILDFIQNQIELNKEQVNLNEEMLKSVRNLTSKIILLEGQNHVIDVVNNIGRRGDNR